ncbi:MAG: ATP-dependent zinc metalloprotease FtsH [Phycisphaerales bacterium]|nr:ATP-dependent zinc metalloprotease FtsH [Phycisphaerales bacterium]
MKNSRLKHAHGTLSDRLSTLRFASQEPRRDEEPRPRPGQKPGEGKPTEAKGPPSRGLFGLITVLMLSLLIVMLITSPGSGERVSLAQFEQLYKDGEILRDSVVIREDRVEAVRRAGPDSRESPIRVALNAATREKVAERVITLTNGEAQFRGSSPWMPIFLTFGPFILILALIWFFISRGVRAAGGGPGGMLGSFGKSRHRTLTKEMTGITFKDVAGIDEAKEEVTEIIEFLRNPKKFTKLGGRIPRGVLLSGNPGCGKTLLAKAIAGEADVPFFSISGSDFVEMFVGVGASRVRDLFKQAKDSAPCIIFLDEIDAVGRRRGSGFNTGGHDEREQTLNAILVEMDGFNSTDGVIVIAATNRPDVLDPALIRPGRFDRQIHVPLPDLKGRLEILRVHARKVKLGPDVDLEKVARGTPMFSGADLAAIINEAAIVATMAGKDFIEHEDLEEARDKVKFGRAKKSRVREKDENKLVAYHEAGHAVLQALLDDADPLHKVTIIPRGDAGGATFSLPEKDRMGYSLKWIRATMRILCGGRIAEQKAMDDVSSGAAMDIAQVTNIARTMILEWGMSDSLGFVRYAGSDTREMFLPEKEYSEETARQIDLEIRRLVDDAYVDAKQLLEANWDKVVAVAEALLKYETLSGDDVARLIRGQTLTKPTVAELLRAEAARKAPGDVVPTPRPVTPPDPEPPAGAMPTPA